MFIVKEHLEYCEACFEREGKPENRDLCICTDFSTLPAPYGKGLVRVVMDGMSNGDGKEAVEIAAQSLLHHLCGQLLRISRTMAEYIDTSVQNGLGGDVIEQQLQEWIYGVIGDALAAADTALQESPYPKPYCTVSVAVVFHRHIFAANLGDSPIYLMDLAEQKRTLVPLFTCDNHAADLIQAGALTEETALHSVHASKLCQFLGYREYSFSSLAHFAHAELPQSCILLLGSDGALSQLLRREMEAVILAHLDDGLSAILEELQLLVGETGSTDDFTLVMDWIKTD